MRELLEALGVDSTREGLLDTPRRVVEAYREVLAPAPFRPTTFAAESNDQLVVVTGIAFGSLCEHHLLPFTGVAHVGYVPAGQILPPVPSLPGWLGTAPRGSRYRSA